LSLSVIHLDRHVKLSQRCGGKTCVMLGLKTDHLAIFTPDI